jgi:hypothetical protein
MDILETQISPEDIAFTTKYLTVKKMARDDHDCIKHTLKTRIAIIDRDENIQSTINPTIIAYLPDQELSRANQFWKNAFYIDYILNRCERAVKEAKFFNYFKDQIESIRFKPVGITYQNFKRDRVIIDRSKEFNKQNEEPDCDISLDTSPNMFHLTAYGTLSIRFKNTEFVKIEKRQDLNSHTISALKGATTALENLKRHCDQELSSALTVLRPCTRFPPRAAYSRKPRPYPKSESWREQMIRITPERQSNPHHFKWDQPPPLIHDNEDVRKILERKRAQEGDHQNVTFSNSNAVSSTSTLPPLRWNRKPTKRSRESSPQKRLQAIEGLESRLTNMAKQLSTLRTENYLQTRQDQMDI